MIGMFTAAENREALTQMELMLRRHDLPDHDRESLEVAAADLRQWLMDLWRLEGGGAGE